MFQVEPTDQRRKGRKTSALSRTAESDHQPPWKSRCYPGAQQSHKIPDCARSRTLSSTADRHGNDPHEGQRTATQSTLLLALHLYLSPFPPPRNPQSKQVGKHQASLLTLCPCFGTLRTLGRPEHDPSGPHTRPFSLWQQAPHNSSRKSDEGHETV